MRNARDNGQTTVSHTPERQVPTAFYPATLTPSLVDNARAGRLAWKMRASRNWPEGEPFGAMRLLAPAMPIPSLGNFRFPPCSDCVTYRQLRPAVLLDYGGVGGALGFTLEMIEWIAAFPWRLQPESW